MRLMRRSGTRCLVGRCLAMLCAVCFGLVVSSCVSQKTLNERLTPPKSSREVRMDDIKKNIEGDPARSIHLIGMFDEIYGDDTPEKSELEFLKTQAVDELSKMQTQAIEDKNWNSAISLARSLAALGVYDEKTLMEPDLLLKEAKENLKNGQDLQAFLYASKSNELRPLKKEDALAFLNEAYKTQRRRTLNYFLNAYLNAGGKNRDFDDDLIDYAQGNDSPSEMIKGVATVLVDRGIKLERGIGSPDRVLGSAFFVDDSGLMLTNYHVVESEVDPSYEGYSRMYIRMGDSTSPRIPAKVIGWDPTIDLALIKANVKPEYVFSVIGPNEPKVGETVLAIGSPVGLEKTVTKGIVSALGRRFSQVGDYIQIDAAVNHGNSGGPVIDTEGILLGVVVAGAEEFEGLNFAIPVKWLSAALPALLDGGKAKRPWLGVALAQNKTGAEIIYTVPQTPASEQVVPEGIYIEKLNGEAIKAPQGELIAAMQDKIFSTNPGELVRLDTSDGKSRVLQTAERPAKPLAQAAKVDTKERLLAPLFGLILEAPVARVSTPSYLVKEVVRGSISDEAGLSPQDPVRIRHVLFSEKDGYAVLDISVRKRASGYIEALLQLPALLASPDLL